MLHEDVRSDGFTFHTSTQIMAMCKMFHEDVRGLSEQYKREAGRINYVTPTSYLELITAFTTLLASKRAEVRDGRRRQYLGTR